MYGTVCPRVFVEDVEGVLVASLVDGELLEQGVIGEVDDQLIELSGWVGASDILLSFRDVQLMSSTLLAVLLRFGRTVSRSGGRLKLCSIAPHLLEVFRITRFDRLFAIYPDEASALCAFEAERTEPRRNLL
ncbi:MAG: STAS domain-containing protein [Isosphaeraceae bacterium]|nr:STAS domain-containing protein [Isosphaeraceae bacterium]